MNDDLISILELYSKAMIRVGYLERKIEELERDFTRFKNGGRRI